MARKTLGGPGRAASGADDLPRPRARPRDARRGEGRAEGLPARGHVPRGALRGDRAPAAWLGRPPSRLGRAAAAGLRPAGVLPLARASRAWGATRSAEVVGVVDRLVVDSAEWRGLPAGYARARRLFERVAVSDIAFARTLPWRRRLAERWPGIGAVERLRVEGPRADAVLLAGWLRSRLRRDVDAGPPRGRHRAASGSTASPSAARRAASTPASCCPPSSTSSAAIRSTRRPCARALPAGGPGQRVAVGILAERRVATPRTIRRRSALPRHLAVHRLDGGSPSGVAERVLAVAAARGSATSRVLRAPSDGTGGARDHRVDSAATLAANDCTVVAWLRITVKSTSRQESAAIAARRSRSDARSPDAGDWRRRSAAGPASRRASSSACRRPFDETALPPSIRATPSRSLNRPPASSTIGWSAARSQT